jgi:hypothetical protein
MATQTVCDRKHHPCDKTAQNERSNTSTSNPCPDNSPFYRKLTEMYRSNQLPVAVSKHRNLSGK